MQSKPSEMPVVEAQVRFMKGLKGSSRPRDWLENRPEVRKPHILSLEEQGKLLDELPIHLRQMVFFQVNTGCREREVCDLQWAWERKVSVLNSLRRGLQE